MLKLNYRNIHPGDLVATRYGYYIQVMKVDKNYVVSSKNLEYEYSELEPIPITKKILIDHLEADYVESKTTQMNEFQFGKFEKLLVDFDGDSLRRLVWIDSVNKKVSEILCLKYFHELQQYFYQDIYKGDRELPIIVD